MENTKRPDVYYPDYLQLRTILGAQAPESDKEKVVAHDEMLFIIIHQTYELWFKQILHEVGSVVRLFHKDRIEAREMNVAVYRLHRVTVILQTLVKQLDILETMTSLDFLDFRDLLRPASGFQSTQWKEIEARLGLRKEERHMKEHYQKDLQPKEREAVQHFEGQPSLLDGVIAWLERMPFLDAPLWPAGQAPFPDRLRGIYFDSMAVNEKERERKNAAEGRPTVMDTWDEMFLKGSPERRLTPKAARHALFIMLYRDEAAFQLPFRLIEALLDIDEGMATWRYRHMNMVGRMIGMRMGTGNSSGKDYLRGALMKHHIFQEFADLSSFLVDRRRLPQLPAAVLEETAFKKA